MHAVQNTPRVGEITFPPRCIVSPLNLKIQYRAGDLLLRIVYIYIYTYILSIYLNRVYARITPPTQPITWSRALRHREYMPHVYIHCDHHGVLCAPFTFLPHRILGLSHILRVAHICAECISLGGCVEKPRVAFRQIDACIFNAGSLL